MIGNAFDTRVLAAQAAVTIFDVLESYGAQLVGRVTQQICCPVHKDRTPSARVYAENNKVYCFTCAKTWNVISLVQAKERCTFEQALDLVEGRFKVPEISGSVRQIVRLGLKRKPAKPLAQTFALIERQIVEARERTPLDRYNRALVALDVVMHQHKHGQLDGDTAHRQAQTIYQYAQGEPRGHL